MENFENWNKKIRNKNLNENSTQRDYDKEPIIIKNYERFLVRNLFFFCFFGASILTVGIFNYNDMLNNATKDNLKEIILCIIIIGISYISITAYFYIIKNSYKIKFTNNFIEFFKNNEIEKQTKLIDLISPVKNFGLSSYPNQMFGGICLSLTFLAGIIANLPIAIVCVWVFAILLNIIFKFCFHFVINRNLKDFSLFSALIIDEPQIKNTPRGTFSCLVEKNYMVYVIKKQDYLDLQKYFSDKKHINLNSVKKNFLA